MIVNNVKGSMDFLPEEQRVRNGINSILRETFEEYGFLPIETPILCYYDMLSGKYDSENDILKEIYKLSDQGDRKLGLRYDLTVPFAKFIALHKNRISFPFKRYEINKVFRDGPVKLGRDREFTQCDVDVVGIYGQLIEAELLSLYVCAFGRLGIDIIIKYNSRNLMSGLILECGIRKDSLSSVITVLDKMHKLRDDEFVLELKKIGVDEEKVCLLKKYFTLSLNDISKEFSSSDNELLKQGLEEVLNLSSYIDSLGIGDVCSFDITLARGQDYYTGNVFEVYEKYGKLSGSIGAGGRYDRMIGDFIGDGESYPAVGASFGLSSIYELLKTREFNDSLYDLYVIPMGTDVDSLKFANELRLRGVKVLLEMSQRKVKKAIGWASRNHIPYVVVIGEDEVNSNKIAIKDMENSRDISFDIHDIDGIYNLLKK